MYIIIAIIAFGFLVAIHELGHFVVARLMGVRVNEFAIGMGPKLLKKQGKETLYTLRLLPFGGFCAMEGEDEDTGDSGAFTAQKRWKRVIILAAGSFMNFLAGFIIILLLFSNISGVAGTTITGLAPGFPDLGENGLQVGDTILEVNGEKAYYSDDFLLFMSVYSEKSGKADIVVLRDGEKVALNAMPLAPREYTENGETKVRYGISFNVIEGTFGQKLKYSCYTAVNNVRLVRVSLVQLFTGNFGVRDLSGPVGIVAAMNDTAAKSTSFYEAIWSIFYFTSFIAINLAVMNMLPIPAVDGGRILFTGINFLLEKITRRKINPKYEGYIHAATLVLLMGVMVFTLVNDVMRIVSG